MVSMIKAVIFDYFGVVSSDTYWRHVREDKNMSGQFSRLSSDVSSGRISWQDFINEVATRTSVSPESVQELYQNEKLDLDMLDYIDFIHQNFKTALLTNAHHEFMDPLVDRAHLHRFFDEILVSSRLGCVKPEPKMYHLACEALGVEPEEAVFIDDIARNVDGAIAIDMRGIIFEDLPRLKLALQPLLTGKVI